MPIHERHLIRPENIKLHEKLILDGIGDSGHWSAFIETRVVEDYNGAIEDEIAALPGSENIHLCWQCGSCTNSCMVNAISPDFNPRYWICLIRTSVEEKLLRDKDIIWQCVACNKGSYTCPHDVAPEGGMKATARWLELKDYTPKSPSTSFANVFSEQVLDTAKIEERRVLRWFFQRTGQALYQERLIDIIKRLSAHLPIKLFATPLRPMSRR